MRSLFRALLFGVLLAAPALAIGCNTAHDGRFLVVVSSDIPSPDQLARVRVEVGGDSHEFSLGPETRLPFSFAVDARPGRPSGETVTIVVSGLDATGAVLMSRPVTTTFRPNRTLVLPVALLRRCTAFALCGEQLRCNATEACTPDGCVSSAIDSDDLREVTRAGDEVAAPLTPDAVCTALADLHCSAAFRCCSAVGSLPAEEQDALLEDCLTTVAENCRTNTLPIFTDARTGFDGARAAAALEVGEGLARQCSLGYARWGVSVEQGIVSSFEGTVAPGGECSFSESGAFFSCRDGACVLEGGTPVCGARSCLNQPCFDALGVDVLESLADFGCTDDLYCSQRTEGPRCERVLPDGTTCLRASQCASGVCLRAPGTCADGNACGVSTECATSPCDTVSGTCHDGTACSSDLQCTYHGCLRDVGVCVPLTVENLYCPMMME